MDKLLRNRGFWGIIVLVVLGSLTSLALHDVVLELHGASKILFSLLFSLVPGLLWLYFYYLQDKYEREPRHFLLGMFVLGAVLSYSISIPIERLFEASHDSLIKSEVNNIIAAILVFGAVQELVKFMAVRYTIYFSSEFNEPADGVIYCIAASLGSAACYNIVYLNGLDAINMGVVPIRVIEYYLLSAVIGGIMGYYMGKAKFNQTNPDRQMLIGYLIAVVLNGITGYVINSVQGMEFSIWRSLLVSVGFVLVLYTVMFYLLQRSVEASPFRNNPETN